MLSYYAGMPSGTKFLLTNLEYATAPKIYFNLVVCTRRVRSGAHSLPTGRAWARCGQIRKARSPVASRLVEVPKCNVPGQKLDGEKPASWVRSPRMIFEVMLDNVESPVRRTFLQLPLRDGISRALQLCL